jgi:hypothetical protein
MLTHVSNQTDRTICQKTIYGHTQIPVIYYNLLDLDKKIFLELAQIDWTGSPYFWHLWWWTIAYTVSDLLWIFLVPHCVRTPKTLIEVCRRFAFFVI